MTKVRSEGNLVGVGLLSRSLPRGIPSAGVGEKASSDAIVIPLGQSQQSAALASAIVGSLKRQGAVPPRAGVSGVGAPAGSSGVRGSSTGPIVIDLGGPPQVWQGQCGRPVPSLSDMTTGSTGQGLRALALGVPCPRSVAQASGLSVRSFNPLQPGALLAPTGSVSGGEGPAGNALLAGALGPALVVSASLHSANETDTDHDGGDQVFAMD